MGRAISLSPPGCPSRAEGARELGNGKDAPLTILLDLLLTHPAEQTQVIARLRLLGAAPTKLADCAMVVQHQSGRRTRTSHRLGLSEEPVSPSPLWVERDPG